MHIEKIIKNNLMQINVSWNLGYQLEFQNIIFMLRMTVWMQQTFFRSICNFHINFKQ